VNNLQRLKEITVIIRVFVVVFVSLLLYFTIIPIPLASGLDKNNAIVHDIGILHKRLYVSFLNLAQIEPVKDFMSSQRSDGSWSDIDYVDPKRSNKTISNHLPRIFSLIQELKKHFGLYNNKVLKTAIHNGLNYWFDKDYQSSNWWWNVIGFPSQMGRILILFNDELSNSQWENGVKILKRAKLDLKNMVGANLADIAMITVVRGVVEEDLSVVSGAVKKLTDEIHVTTDIGIQPDFSFHQHGALLYNHGYGAVFMLDCSLLATIVYGTAFEFRADKIMLLNNLILDGSRSMMRYATKDYGAMGRGVTRPSVSGNRTDNYMHSVVDNMLKIPTGRKSEYELFKEQLNATVDDQNYPFFCGAMGNKHFWCSDIMTHSMPYFYTSVRMHSDRLLSNDLVINEEGFYTHHLSDGCMYILQTGREYCDIFPVWDWNKVPGTTVELEKLPPGEVQETGTTSFVGGVSDGSFGLAVFDFKRGNLSAKKSWFFFGNEIACLGAGINSSSGNTVITTINQCFIKGNIKIFKANGDNVEINSRGHEYCDITKIYHNNVVYQIEKPGEVHLSNEKQSGSWWKINHSYQKDKISKDIFSLWINHGEHPTDASYAYVISILGAMTASTPFKMPEPHSMEIIVNTKTLQAVYNKKHNIAGVVFFEPGSVKFLKSLKISVDRACLILVNLKRPNFLRVSVSNPRNKAMSANIEIERNEMNNTTLFAKKSVKKIVNFNLPSGIYAGKSLCKTIVFN